MFLVSCLAYLLLFVGYFSCWLVLWSCVAKCCVGLCCCAGLLCLFGRFCLGFLVFVFNCMLLLRALVGF